jgi:hypothetical protein
MVVESEVSPQTGPCSPQKEGEGYVVAVLC